ncbi:alpha-1,6-glucosidases, pullulanase-type [Duganella sp. CF458]|uniref:alpha-1,6-glucosidase domain-containing protein n=1 Tax=Duganella sp. CF458 TaxID=1884368 RepID=UPI0008E5A51C|nr:alpha-1,6-glucosidase domain-containing protein [Duganella sp. CF458]SFF50886.1 alpha-1,6-glucosidases, pullulanase-type [Duganella sp. CF458]
MKQCILVAALPAVFAASSAAAAPTTALTAAPTAATPHTLASCDGPHETVLARTQGFDARALWLDGRLAKWPGVQGEGSFKLYYAGAAGISAPQGGTVSGAEGVLPLAATSDPLPAPLAQRFKYAGDGQLLALADADRARLPALLAKQLVLVRENADGTVRDATALQVPGALDDIYASAEQATDLGATIGKGGTAFKLWAPTAQRVSVCIFDTGSSKPKAITTLRADAKTGIWSASARGNLSGRYYKYVVDVVAPQTGLVRNVVTDPYSVSLTTDSARSYIADLADPRLAPAGWNKDQPPAKVAAQPDMSIYELHVRDFSINDQTVSAMNRGKYTAFRETGSNGMKHLAMLAKAGMTDVHLLPVYDLGSVPERGCVAPVVHGDPDSDQQQKIVSDNALKDCFNWGYDPWHYNAPEGSYSTDASDGARRIIELREMVMALHKTGLRVGTDVVYNHTYRGGQHERSVLDRIVPGYYQRLNPKGEIESSTCCFNTATENRMMAKLMIDSAELWTKHYHIDSFRFDLMGHQPRAAMEALQARVNKAAGRHVNLIGEGWNFGEVADGARFVQASQLSLNGSGIGTFSDRARDAVRGGGAGDSGQQVVSQQGYVNGLVYDPNAGAGLRPVTDLMAASDLVKVGLAGSIRSYRMQTFTGETKELRAIVYGGSQPAGYASQPGEVVNYVENHDNQTLYDINALKLPVSTTSADRARVQMLAAAINAFSQGVAYYHAGFEILRSKSMDRNSFESGDWFNRLDWTYQTNYFGSGLPPAADNGKDYALLQPLLANRALQPTPVDIAFARDTFRDLLRIRASSTLFRMRTADDIKKRLLFLNTGPDQVATVVAARLDGAGYEGAGFKTVAYFINVDKVEQTISAASEAGKAYRLHRVQAGSAARYDAATGSFTIPPRTAIVFVE